MLFSHQPSSTPICPYANQPYTGTWPAYQGDPSTEPTNIETPFNYSSHGGISSRAQLAVFDEYPEKNTGEQAWPNQCFTFDGQAVVSNNVDTLSYQEGRSWITNDSFLQTEPEGQNTQSNPPGVLFNSPHTCNGPSIGFDDSLPLFTESTSLSQLIDRKSVV